MICSSLARNRSPDPVVSCCFGRIVPSDATTESQFASKGNPENEIARFRALKPQYLAISIPPARQKQILRQWASRCSQTTTDPALPCTPCQLEGCERSLDSYSQCLDELSPQQVIAAIDQAPR